MGLATDGETLFVATSGGAVFALQASTGDIQWAATYPRRTIEVMDVRRRIQIRNGAVVDFEPTNLNLPLANFISPQLDVVLMLASDSDQLLAFDRRNGSLKWEAPLGLDLAHSCREVLGVTSERIVLGGTQLTRAYDLKGGRVVWEAIHPVASGRGMLLGDSVYVPLRNTILRLDGKSGEVRGESVVPSLDGLPVGNLSTDGKRIIVSGPGVVMALVPKEDKK